MKINNEELFGDHAKCLKLDLDQAIAIGQPYYWTGIPCKNGHASWRYVSARNCLQCSRDKRYKESQASGAAETERRRAIEMAIEERAMKNYYD